MIRIETDRLLLRDHSLEDLNDYHAWMSDPAVMRYIIGFKQSNTRDESLASLKKTIEGINKTPRTNYFIAIAQRDTGRYIGSGGGFIERLESNGGIMEIGYMLKKDFWGLGYTTEATKAWIDYSFRYLCVHRIIAHCDCDNASSEKVMQKCGMEKEAVLKQHRYHNGSWRDGLQYAVVKEEWRRGPGK